MNETGTYGSPTSNLSVRNQQGPYGSPSQPFSATNASTNTPPIIYKFELAIANLTANTILSPDISLAGIDAVCNLVATEPAVSQSLPLPPPQVDASKGTDSELIYLTWASVSDATSYNVYFSENADSAKILIDSSTGTSMTITGAVPGVVYYFWVFSTNAAGESVTGTSDTGYAGDLAASFLINTGLNDAWYDPATSGQGLLITVFPNSDLVFAAWFTFDAQTTDAGIATVIGGPGQRWFTAQGAISGNSTTMDVYSSEGGEFDTTEPQPNTRVVGTMTITWHDCENATLTYDIYDSSRTGSIEWVRIANDSVAVCEALSEP